MDGNFDPVFANERPGECSEGECREGLQLRRHVLKLRWLGLESEADRLAGEIAKLACRLPRRLPPRVVPTD